MALSERSRTTIYHAFEPLVGDEAIEEMLSYFPARDVEEPVTKEYLDRRLAELDAGLRTGLRTELHREIGGLRSELHTEIGGLRTELYQEIGGLRTELHRAIGGLRAELHQEIRAATTRFITWTVSALLGGLGIAFAVGQATG